MRIDTDRDLAFVQSQTRRDEITAKAQRLAAFSGSASESEMLRAMAALWDELAAT
jgi:hypothetical protein